MKKIFVLSVLVSSMLFFGCKKEDDDVRDPYCGTYIGSLTRTSIRNGNEMSEKNQTKIEVRKNGGNKKSVSVYNALSESFLFSTEAMSVVNTKNGDGFCGHVYENVSNNEDGIAVSTTGNAISGDSEYSCEIIPNEAGTLVLRFNAQKSYTSHDLETIENYEFEGTKN